MKVQINIVDLQGNASGLGLDEVVEVESIEEAVTDMENYLLLSGYEKDEKGFYDPTTIPQENIIEVKDTKGGGMEVTYTVPDKCYIKIEAYEVE